ncbi:MAG: DNA replication/repair protein RecF [Alteromonadaceae bacterium]|nr:MAG: DNA replication/repair protein RecF [Alteromonadaceae bacterium]
MSEITRLTIINFRNLVAVQLDQLKRINFFYGLNGAGKSSLLEAISVIALGRSYRTRKTKLLINHGAQKFVLFAQVSELQSDGEKLSKVGVEKVRHGKDTVRVDETTVSSAAELAVITPIIVINSASFCLFEGSPKDRRKFFDWLVFHVKHDFGDLWRDVTQCIKQRNALLRNLSSDASELVPWDEQLVKLAYRIDELRVGCFKLFHSAFNRAIEKLGFCSEDVNLIYVSGWRDDGNSYAEQLHQAYDRDRKLGYTSLGPTKSEFKIFYKGLAAVDVLSRGQQKLLATAMYFSIALVFSELTKRLPVFLLDDIHSEMDLVNQRNLGKWISELKAQCFVTGVDQEQFESWWPADEVQQNDRAMFHVKHGEVTRNAVISEEDILDNHSSNNHSSNNNSLTG